MKYTLAAEAMLMGGSASGAADVIAPPVLKYQTDVPSTPRPVLNTPSKDVRDIAANSEMAKRGANVALSFIHPR